MYNTGNADFLAAACSPNREIDTQAQLNFPEGDVVSVGTNDIVSYKTTSASMGNKAFAPGNFVAGQLELSLNAASPVIQAVDFKHKSLGNIQLTAGIRVVNAWVNIPMGVYYPDKDGIKVTDDGFVSISASNIPPELSEVFDASVLTFPCSVGDVLSQIQTDTGLPVSVDWSEFPNLEIELEENFTLTSTYRETLMYLAEVLGGYVIMGRNGEICVRRCFSGLANIGCVLDENYLFSVNKQEDSVKPFQYIGIKANTDDLGVTWEVEGITTECRYDIVDNPLTYGHPEDFLPGLVDPLNFTEFYPATLSFQGRPDLDVGDVLEYIYKGTTYILPICSHIFEYNGGFKTSVESVGSNSPNTSSADSGLKTQITALKQNINALVRDLTHTQSQIVEINGELVSMSEVLQTVEALKTQISKIEGDVEKVSTLTQTADQLRLDIKSVVDGLATTNDTVANNQNTLLSYFDFKADSLTIGVSNSNIKLKLSNNKVYFLKDEQEVAYFSEGQLYVTDAHFIRSLVLGNFEFTPRSNGNLSLRRRG